jgi:polar amino acid transport system substrate-binding protein
VNRRRCLGLAAALAIIATACSSISANDAATRDAQGKLRLLTPPTTAKTTSVVKCTTNDDTARSFAPGGPLPPPGHMPARSYMAEIQRRGHLVAGVDQNTLGFGYRDANGDIKGFDIEIVRAIANAIFGNPNAVVLKAVTSAQRKTAVVNEAVDVVASLMSITCDRWQVLDFSTEYYAARQGVLVRKDSPIRHVGDLNGKRVCATRGSTSIDQIHKFAPRAVLDPVDLRPECLVHLQEGTADAISTDDTILYGLAYQDRYNTRLLTDDLEQPERYGIAISQKRPEFVRFVNGVLDQVRADGRWERYHRQQLAYLGIPATTPPPPLYGRQP